MTTKLSILMDKRNWEWLEDDDIDAANALADDVASGKDPATVRRDLTAAIGETRIALINRCESAARHLVRQREAKRA